MLTTVLFDLDGTLLPMDQDAFVNGYLKLMIQKMAPYGYSPEKLIGCIWKGTQAMYANSGAETNEALFWSIFEDSFGKKSLADQPLFEDFYRNEFQQAAQCCGFDPRAREAVDAIHAMGLTTALATNPLFPAVATESRVRWAGLQPEDFRLITTYENSHYCKPNPDYYREILSNLGLEPEQCVMVGNNAREDMVAGELGMAVYLVTDHPEDCTDADLARYPHGSFAEMEAWLLG